MAVWERKGESPALQDGFGPAWVQAVPEEEAAVPARCAMFILLMMMDALSMTDALSMIVSFPYCQCCTGNLERFPLGISQYECFAAKEDHSYGSLSGRTGM